METVPGDDPVFAAQPAVAVLAFAALFPPARVSHQKVSRFLAWAQVPACPRGLARDCCFHHRIWPMPQERRPHLCVLVRQRRDAPPVVPLFPSDDAMR